MRSIIAQYLGEQPGAARNGLFRGFLSALLSSSFVLTLMMSCNPPITVPSAPPSELSISLAIYNQYTTNYEYYLPAGMVQISVSVQQGGQERAIGGNLSLACNGAVFHWEFYNSTPVITLPRQPAGGAYHCVYTNESGKTTSITIPIPQEPELEVTSPAPNAVVPIPAPSSSLTIHYILPTLPSGARDGGIKADAVATCLGGPKPLLVQGDFATATGAYVLADNDMYYSTGFRSFIPSHGGIVQVRTMISWSLPPGGFQEVHVEYDDALVSSVTWSRAPAA